MPLHQKKQWIWKDPNWPNFYWEETQVSKSLATAWLTQGKLLGIIQTIHTNTTEQVSTELLARQAIDTSAIEGEQLNRDSVRSSINNRLGVKKAGVNHRPDRYKDSKAE